MILTIKEAEYVGGHKVKCLFNDGVIKLVDFTPLLQYPTFQDLKEEHRFAQFGLRNTLFWSNGTDIAPEYLYEHGTTCEA